MAEWKNRVVGLETHKAGDLIDHPLQWKVHPDYQLNVLRGLLDQVGIADVLLAYKSKAHKNKLVRIDGHARKSLDPDQEWPVIILDVDDEEARLLLAVHDRTAAMSATDGEKLAVLMEEIPPSEFEAVNNLLIELTSEAEQTALKEYSGGSGRDLGDTKKQIKAVLYAEEIGVFEAAIHATGIKNRGEAIIAVCRSYLESVGHATGQFDPALESFLAAASVEGN